MLFIRNRIHKQNDSTTSTFPLYNNDNNDLYSLREKCSYKAHTNDII